MFEKFGFKKAISPVVATALLLVVAVVSVVGFQGWFTEFSSSMFVDVETQTSSNSDLMIDTLVGKNLYVKNDVKNNLSIEKIIIGGVICDFNDSINLGVQKINVKDCLKKVNSSNPEIVIHTKDKILNEFAYFEVGSIKLDNCNFNGSFVKSGEDSSFYSSSSVPYGSSCVAPISRTCNDGIFEGDNSYNYSSCVVDPKLPGVCMATKLKPGCESYYIDSGVTITDTLLSLEWEKTSSFSGTSNWDSAVSYCNGLDFDGHTDWRLPTLPEIEYSIVDNTKSSPRIIDVGFIGIQSNYYWTETIMHATAAYVISLHTGASSGAGKSGTFNVLCVRKP